jgi:ferrochelatase
MRPLRIGVVLFQTGEPESLDAVVPYLRNLHARSGSARSLLSGVTARLEARRVHEKYRLIGGGSPLLGITALQQRALETRLRREIDARVFAAMLDRGPSNEQALKSALQAGCDKLLLLPLHPFDCPATTGRAFNDWRATSRRLGWEPACEIIRSYHDDSNYLDAVAERINQAFVRLDAPQQANLIFHAGDVPALAASDADSYALRVEAAVRSLTARAAWANPLSICSPGGMRLDETLERLGRESTREALLVSIATVSDCFETLHNLAIVAREQALQAGVGRIETVPGLNDSPAFIEALARLSLAALAGSAV